MESHSKFYQDQLYEARVFKRALLRLKELSWSICPGSKHMRCTRQNKKRRRRKTTNLSGFIYTYIHGKRQRDSSV